MVTIKKDNRWKPDSVQKEWHYISWTPYSQMAVSGYASMSWVYAICFKYSGLSEEKLCSMFSQIDRREETGTFYPTANITIMPSRKQRVYSPEQLRKHMEEVKEAQYMIDADDIYWDCRFEVSFMKDELYTALITDSFWCEKNNYIVVNN